jgi:hypothetical protein
LGLGGYPAVTLAQAHESARAKRQAVLQGRDPVIERRAAKSSLHAAQQKQIAGVDERLVVVFGAGQDGWRQATRVALTEPASDLGGARTKRNSSAAK